jgi:hypothetical protein
MVVLYLFLIFRPILLLITCSAFMLEGTRILLIKVFASSFATFDCGEMPLPCSAGRLPGVFTLSLTLCCFLTCD